MTALVRQRMAQLHAAAPGSIGDMLDFRLPDPQPGPGAVQMTCQTAPWMGNAYGTLHGGLGAAILDQAMGFVSYCMKPGEGIAPTVQLSVDYHRPLRPGRTVLVTVRPVHIGGSLMKFTAEAADAAAPDKICLSASAIFCYKPSEKI